MLIMSVYWIKIFAPNLVQRCITAIRRWSHDKNRIQKLIHMMLSTNVGNKSVSTSGTIKDISTKFGTELKQQTTVMAEWAKFTCHENLRWRHTAATTIQNSENVISGLDKGIGIAGFDIPLHTLQVTSGTIL